MFSADTIDIVIVTCKEVHPGKKAMKECKGAWLCSSQEDTKARGRLACLAWSLDAPQGWLWAQKPTIGSSGRTWRGLLIPAKNVKLNPSHESADVFRSFYLRNLWGELSCMGLERLITCICLQQRQINCCALGLDFFCSFWFKELWWL